MLKFFEAGTEETRAQLIWAARHFEDSTILKPTHSRPTNSEAYLVGVGFRTEPRIVDVAAWDRSLRRIVAALCEAQRLALEATLLRAQPMSTRPHRHDRARHRWAGRGAGKRVGR